LPNGMYAEMNRFDFRNFKETPAELEDILLENLEKSLSSSQGVVVCDQYQEPNNAAVTSRVRRELADIAARHPDKIFYADSRWFTGSFRGVIIKCNRLELESVAQGLSSQEVWAHVAKGLPNLEKRANVVQGASSQVEQANAVTLVESSLEEQARRLLSSNGKAVVVTLGADGAYVLEREGEPMVHVPAFRVDGPIDITGAGDATNAGVITGLACGLTLPEAVMLGGCISSITIQQLGVTGTATVEQVKERLANYNNI